MRGVVATGVGARSGVLFRNAEALETLEKVDTIIVGKTGTLTEGKPRLLVIEPAPGFRAVVAGRHDGFEPECAQAGDCVRRVNRSGRALPGFDALPDDCSRRDERQFGFGHRQCAAVAHRETLEFRFIAENAPAIVDPAIGALAFLIALPPA